jgi:hypothetical protein
MWWRLLGAMVMHVNRARRLACEGRGPRGTTWRRLSRSHGLGGGDDDGSVGGDLVGYFLEGSCSAVGITWKDA